MKIYVHKNGKTSGPYTIAQLKDYLRAKNVNEEDLACHDGKNWIRLSEVPGIAPSSVNSSLETLPSASTQGGENNSVAMKVSTESRFGKKTFAIGVISFTVIALTGISFFMFSVEEKNAGVPRGGQSEAQENDSDTRKDIPQFAKFDPRPAAKKIDEFIFANLKKNNLSPNEEISDEQFVRRVYLAIIGRIPTIDEADNFHQSTSPEKHSLLYVNCSRTMLVTPLTITSFGQTFSVYPLE